MIYQQTKDLNQDNRGFEHRTIRPLQLRDTYLDCYMLLSIRLEIQVKEHLRPCSPTLPLSVRLEIHITSKNKSRYGKSHLTGGYRYSWEPVHVSTIQVPKEPSPCLSVCNPSGRTVRPDYLQLIKILGIKCFSSPWCSVCKVLRDKVFTINPEFPFKVHHNNLPRHSSNFISEFWKPVAT